MERISKYTFPLVIISNIMPNDHQSKEVLNYLIVNQNLLISNPL